MNCQDIQNRFNSYVDGQLSGSERNQVEAHLKECRLCKAALAEIDSLAAVLLQADNPPAPSNLTDKIMAAAQDRFVQEPSTFWNPVAWLRLASVPMQAAAAGVLVVGLSLGFTLGKSIAESPEPQATAGSQADPLEIYQLNFFNDAPSGSLADSYLALITTGNEGEK